MKWLRRLGFLVVGIAALFALLAFFARFSDGPVVILPGGPFQTGAWQPGDADLSFAEEVEEIELESGGSSRTVWVLVDEGEAYVPASLDFPPGKRWHLEALEDPDAVVRIEGRRYPRQLAKVEDRMQHDRLYEMVGQKYGGLPNADPTRTWFFHLAPGP